MERVRRMGERVLGMRGVGLGQLLTASCVWQLYRRLACTGRRLWGGVGPSWFSLVYLENDTAVQGYRSYIIQ